MTGSAGHPREEDLRTAIFALLEQRDPGRTICPSEAARVVGGDDGFRELMPAVREVAREEVGKGTLEITQSGRVVDPDTARGPIRLRLPPRD